MMAPPRTLGVDTSVAGYWRVVVYPKRRGYPSAVDISLFRGQEVKVQKMSFADPFGPKSATLRLPQMSYLDRRGDGDLWWLVPYADVDIRWVGPLPSSYGFGQLQIGFSGSVPHTPVVVGLTPSFVWTGRIEPFAWTSKDLTLQLKGAVLVGDDILAKPEYPHSPLPYEWAMAKKFLSHPSLNLKGLRVIWPSWWTQRYGPPPKGTPSYLIPQGVNAQQFWSALVTRQTGSWDPQVTSYMLTLLAAMYTDRGRWTIDLMDGREPVLVHRDMLTKPNDSTVVLDVTDPDNQLSLTEDFSQAIAAVYGQGTSLAGNVYSGMHVTPSGMLTSYDPLAALRQVHPENDHNEWLDRGHARKEVMLQMQDGLTELQARGVAEAHLRRFGDPGVTGQITVTADATVNGTVLHRHLIRAGMTVSIPNVFGRPEGVLAHITDNEIDLLEDTNTLTLDSKYRDALTVEEVRKRGRDSLQVQRMLTVGAYSPPIPDQLIPWDYATGSGYIPSAPGLTSQRLFDGMPDDLEFPWTPWTTTHPPSSARWRKSYIHIGAANAKADNNWAFYGSPKAGRLAIPIRMAQAGQIRLVQIAAYDAAGHVLPVPFHFSLYSFHGVGVNSMPKIPAGQRYGTFTVGQHYPFGKDAWEKYRPDGTLQDPNIPQPATQGGLIRGWGDFYEKAGYWPGSQGSGTAPTGLYVDESVWSFDLTQNLNQFNPYTTKQLGEYRGMAFLMIYCDAQGSEDVYFLGRLFRVEPGAQS